MPSSGINRNYNRLVWNPCYRWIDVSLYHTLYHCLGGGFRKPRVSYLGHGPKFAQIWSNRSLVNSLLLFNGGGGMGF